MSATEWSQWSELASDVVLRLIGASDDELDRIVHETLGQIATQCRAERSYVTFYDPTDDTFDISHEWTEGVVPHRPAIQKVGIDRFPWSVGYADRQEVLAVDDLDSLPPEADAERQSFGAFGVRSVLQVPIVHNGVTVGLAGLNRFTDDGGGWTTPMIEFVRRVGQAVGIALVRQRAAREVAAAVAKADDARRSRDELLAHVSHELRTPLHAILGYAELLELDERSEQDREALMRIQTNGRQLLGMIDDLSVLARSDREPADRTDLAPVLAQVVDDLGPIATDRGLELVGGPMFGVTGVTVNRYRQIARCLVIGAAQSMRDGTITLESWDDDGSTTLRVRLASTTAIARDGLVLPMAEMLVDGHGHIGAEHTADATHATVTASFDPVDRPG